MGKSTISMAMFHCYVSSPEGSWVNPRTKSPFSIANCLFTRGYLMNKEFEPILDTDIVEEHVFVGPLGIGITACHIGIV